MLGSNRMQYVDFTITVKDEKSLSIQYADHRGPRDREGKLIPNPLAQFIIRRMNEWVNLGLLIKETANRDALDPADLKAIGLSLYNILFGDPEVEMRFRDLYEDLSSDREARRCPEDSRMRLRLVFGQGAARLGELPWELLYIPHKSTDENGLPNGRFFGELGDLILTRYSPSPSGADQSFDIGEQPLNILLAIYTDFPQMNKIRTEEIELVRNQMRLIPGAKILEDVRNLSYDEFKDRLTQGQPHIVHFIGHGDAGKITLAYSKDDEDFNSKDPTGQNQVRWVTSQEFRRLFDYTPKPRLVFLQACNGSANPTNSLSCAQELIQAGIPAVIAMQHSIRASDATNFATTFYQNIAKGADVDEAVRAGRYKLGGASYNHPRFGTPVVYLRTEDKLVSLKKLAEKSELARTQPTPPAARGSGAGPAAPPTTAVTPVAEKPSEQVSQFERTGQA